MSQPCTEKVPVRVVDAVMYFDCPICHNEQIACPEDPLITCDCGHDLSVESIDVNDDLSVAVFRIEDDRQGS